MYGAMYTLSYVKTPGHITCKENCTILEYRNLLWKTRKKESKRRNRSRIQRAKHTNKQTQTYRRSNPDWRLQCQNRNQKRKHNSPETKRERQTTTKTNKRPKSDPGQHQQQRRNMDESEQEKTNRRKINNRLHTSNT